MEQKMNNGIEQNSDIVLLDSEKTENIGEHHHSHHHSHHSHHSSHHHHSGRHHRRSGRKNKKKQEKIKRFWKHNKHKIINIILGILLVVAIVIIGLMADKSASFEKENNTSNLNSGASSETENKINIEIPFYNEQIVLVSPAVTKYLSSDISVSASKFYNDYRGLGRLDQSSPVKLGYRVSDIPEGCSVRSAELLVSETNDFKSSIIYTLDKKETSVDVYNLKTGMQYYYRIVLSLSNGSKTSIEGSFNTADTPRFLNVDGTCNLRDIGGYKTVNGKKIRQGLLYRSAEIDGVIDSKYKISDNGINTLLNDLGIKFDMDLRSVTMDSNKTDILGAGVNHKYYEMVMYSEVFTENGKSEIKKVFSDLANKENYPMLMHCTHGMDRTGTVCYLLEAILGMSEIDMMREYQLSAFYHGELWGMNQLHEFIGMLKSYDGATINEKAETYLLSAGVTEEEIKSIKDIFLS